MSAAKNCKAYALPTPAERAERIAKLKAEVQLAEDEHEIKKLVCWAKDGETPDRNLTFHSEAMYDKAAKMALEAGYEVYRMKDEKFYYRCVISVMPNSRYEKDGWIRVIHAGQCMVVKSTGEYASEHANCTAAKSVDADMNEESSPLTLKRTASKPPLYVKRTQ